MRVSFHETERRVSMPRNTRRIERTTRRVCLACCLIYSMFYSHRRGPQVILNFDMATEAGRAAALKASQSANGTADGAAGVLAELATVVEAGGADPDSGSVKESGWISSVSVGDVQRWTPRHRTCGVTFSRDGCTAFAGFWPRSSPPPGFYFPHPTSRAQHTNPTAFLRIVRAAKSVREPCSLHAGYE